MLKFLKRTIAASTLAAALLTPLKSKADDYLLQEPTILGNGTLLGSEFSSYGTLDYGAEAGFSMNYDGKHLSITYQDFTYTTGEDENDFIDGLLLFANSTNSLNRTPIEGILDDALKIPEIRNYTIGRFTMEDISFLFKSFYDLFEDSITEDAIEGQAHLRLRGRLDLQQYSRMRFSQNGTNGFFDHGTRINAGGDAHARFAYRLIEGEEIRFGTEYDRFLDKQLELSIDAQFKAWHSLSDSYRIGIDEGNNSYGLGMTLSRFYSETGSERANVILSSELSNWSDGLLAYMDAQEGNARQRVKGENALAYFFHSGENGLVWHSAYFGIEFPDYEMTSEESSTNQSIRIALDRTVTQEFEGAHESSESSYDSQRLSYGFLIGLGNAPFQPVLNVSRFYGSRFIFNVTLPYIIFNISSDLEMPHNFFLTTDRSNAEHLARFIRVTEESNAMPFAVPNAVNDYSRLNAYSNLDDLTLSLSSENETISGSAIYAERQRYFLEIGANRSSIDNPGVFFRLGFPSLMATLNYSYGNELNEDYYSHGLGLKITGGRDNLYYTLAARRMVADLTRYHYQTWDYDEFRMQFILGGNF